MPDRRSFLGGALSAPFVGGLFSKRSFAAVTPQRDFFKELGVRPFINAAGTFTRLTSSLMPAEVMQAMDYGSRQYVRLSELQDAVGARIASMIGCEAAMITAGAASAISIGTASILTGTDKDRIHRLPDTTGMKNEAIIQKAHRNSYDHAVRACGMKLVEIETSDEMERAINDKTGMLVFFNLHEPDGRIQAEEFAAFGKRRGIPSLNDAAADVPPVANLSRFTKMGFDLVSISGGKGIRGPQSCGLLLGRKDLIEAAKLNTSPNSDSICRGMKVNKEEMLGMLVALELFLKQDHAAEWKEWERRVGAISDSVRAIPGVAAEAWVPPIANHVPHLKLRWDTGKIRISVDEVMKQLREGEPSIEASPDSKDDLIIAVWMMQKGDAQIVARRLRQILKGAVA